MECSGDCDRDGRVSIDEPMLGINIAIGRAPLAACASFDANHDGVVAITRMTSQFCTLIDEDGLSVSEEVRVRLSFTPQPDCPDLDPTPSPD